ncbi:hypothetical protein DL766_000378 [Monosporascus sp. MC13-8B]|uniref:Uncharacterized protein n=1 Tax=Monosporascus cannonballus TaxID=155416 RepID=A0ABY0HH25_9PEZI|nr:hypothetical protein DL762_001688 [Monosporascus cannonballus]RYO99962.1 hypothetical protein DL763_001093 [Monosporascus cannonballus]RYP39556.1 hypothetical protein DL766_000378 [Monosporascus sp. MC13-8B]
MQGFNMGRYVPPDVEGTTTGNKLHGKHALGARASKLASQGVLTVRFEMPFAVWCGHCARPTVIGQGVRFNAEKRRVGHYHSTPVFAFRMRHADCGGAIEIRTDPRNTTYVVVEGGRRRDAGDEKGDDGDLVPAAAPILTDAERDRLRGDALAKLERTIEDRRQLERARERIGELEEASARGWEDPYERNRRLRASFRVGRHAREGEARAAEDLRDRMSLGIDLVPATEEDARRAALVDFGPVAAAEDDGGGSLLGGDKALSRPLFGSPSIAPQQQKEQQQKPGSDGKKKKRLKSEIAASQMRENLVSEIVGNTRAAQDPFLSQNRNEEGAKTASRILGIKRKRQEPEGPKVEEGHTKEEAPSVSLVEYDSD